MVRNSSTFQQWKEQLKNNLIAFAIFAISMSANAAKEIALTFDDAPFETSSLFDTNDRTKKLIKKLKELDIPKVMIFANACKRPGQAGVIEQLKQYTDAGHLMANHTCSHSRLDDVGFDNYTKEILTGEAILLSLMPGQKFFRYPYLNESKDKVLRDKVRAWLKIHKYRNGLVSIDNADYLFSSEVEKARGEGRKIDFEKIKTRFVKHIVGSVEFYDDLAVKTIGRSPKHVLLLHERDITVMFIDSVVKELRAKGWKIISPLEAYTDKFYNGLPKNTYSGDGFTAQMAMEKTGKAVSYRDSENLQKEIVDLLQGPQK